MVPYVVALLMLVTASDARQGNKQFLRPQNEAPLFNGDITHIKGEYVVVLKAKVDVTKHVEKLRQSLSKDERIIAAFDFEPFIGYGAILLDRTVTTLRGNQDVEMEHHGASGGQSKLHFRCRTLTRTTLSLQEQPLMYMCLTQALMSLTWTLEEEHLGEAI
ncbi:hypothetical protein EMCRGX_G030172 [Ephydatia muelleri]